MNLPRKLAAWRNGAQALLGLTLARCRGRRLSWTATMHALKYNKTLSLEADMRAEIREFFGVSEEALRQLEADHGPFHSRQFQLYLYSLFEGKTGDDKRLFQAYADNAFLYCLALGIGCPRYATLYPFLEFLLEKFAHLERKPLAVDYGSGVGDTSLLLATCGFDVCLVDFADRKTEFALWRLRRRGFAPQWIQVSDADPYPALPDNVDLIVTIEVWEHLREPLRALRNLLRATAPGRSYLHNTNEGFDYQPEGDHLADGIAQGKSASYRELYEAHWRPLPIKGHEGHGRLYERIGPPG